MIRLKRANTQLNLLKISLVWKKLRTRGYMPKQNSRIAQRGSQDKKIRQLRLRQGASTRANLNTLRRPTRPSSRCTTWDKSRGGRTLLLNRAKTVTYWRSRHWIRQVDLSSLKRSKSSRKESSEKSKKRSISWPSSSEKRRQSSKLRIQILRI